MSPQDILWTIVDEKIKQHESNGWMPYVNMHEDDYKIMVMPYWFIGQL
jgi:hypothetical protein